MALVIGDRIKATTSTTGTGAYTIGATASGFQGFGAIGDGNTTYYAVTDNTSNYEVGLGTYTASGGTLARTTVLESSNSDAAVDWGAGDKDIFVTVPAAKFLFKDASGNVGGGLTTDKLAEGSTNLYFTNARVDARLSGGTGVTYNQGEVSIGQAVGTTDDVTFDDVIVSGDLTVNGTTTTVNSTTVTIDDPIFTIGGDTAPSSDDSKDRGIEFRWHDGSSAKVGFFGFDDSAGKFTFIPDASNSSEVFSGAVGTVLANLDGNSSTATTLQTSRSIALTGSVTGTATFNGGADASIATTLTAADVLTAVNSVDGTGSGLDSDLLDGQEGSYYLDGNNFTNLPSGGVTFSDLLYGSWVNSGQTSAGNAAYWGLAALDDNNWPTMYAQISTYTIYVGSDNSAASAYRFRKVYRTYS